MYPELKFGPDHYLIASFCRRLKKMYDIFYPFKFNLCECFFKVSIFYSTLKSNGCWILTKKDAHEEISCKHIPISQSDFNKKEMLMKKSVISIFQLANQISRFQISAFLRYNIIVLDLLHRMPANQITRYKQSGKESGNFSKIRPIRFCQISWKFWQIEWP